MLDHIDRIKKADADAVEMLRAFAASPEAFLTALKRKSEKLEREYSDPIGAGSRAISGDASGSFGSSSSGGVAESPSST